MYSPEFQHLLDFLDSNPEYLQDMRTRLLMPDLIALPEQFAQLVGLVTDLSTSFHDFAEATDRRLTSIETDVGVLKTDVSTLKADVGTPENRRRNPENRRRNPGHQRGVPEHQRGVPEHQRGVPERQRSRKPRPTEHPEHRHERTRAQQRPCSARHRPRHRTRVPGHHQRCRGNRPHHGAASGPRPSRGTSSSAPAAPATSNTYTPCLKSRAPSGWTTSREHTAGPPRSRPRPGEPTIAAVVGEAIQPPQQTGGRRGGRQGPVAAHAPAADAERRRNGGPHLLNAERTPRVASVTPPNYSPHFNAAVLGAVRRLRW